MLKYGSWATRGTAGGRNWGHAAAANTRSKENLESIPHEVYRVAGARRYNWSMARGWESKSVEAQIDMAEVHRAAPTEKEHDSAALEAVRKRESLLLSRTRVVRDMENAQNPRYKAVLSKALADLEAQLSAVRVD
jgi:hypothetical protein